MGIEDHVLKNLRRVMGIMGRSRDRYEKNSTSEMIHVLPVLLTIKIIVILKQTSNLLFELHY